MTKWICFVLRFTCLLNNWQNKSSRETKSGKRNPIIINHYTDSKKMARERGRELKCNPFVNLEGAAYRIHNMLAVSKHRYPRIYNTWCLFCLRDCKIKKSDWWQYKIQCWFSSWRQEGKIPKHAFSVFVDSSMKYTKILHLSFCFNLLSSIWHCCVVIQNCKANAS